MNPRSAFTLIELLIALALGLVLICTAAAGLRVATQTVTVANRLALENEIMRSGFEIALDEVDLWRAYDDPVDATRMGQRGKGGLFAPFKTSVVGVSPLSPESPRTIDVANLPPANDGQRGWDSGFSWPAADPRTWWRNNLSERSHSSLTFGGYKRFSSAGPVDDVGMTHTWLANQVQGLASAIGYYGMADYLPSGSIYAFAGGSDPVTSGGMCKRFIASAPQNFLCDDDGAAAADFSQSLYRATKNTAVAAYPLSTDAAVNGAASRFNHWDVGQRATAATMSVFQRAALSRDKVLSIRPATWPALSVSIARTLAFARFACVARIRWTSPLTGTAAELSFCCFGTTLRGARQQRRPDAGWAAWHSADATAAPPSGNDLNLDNGN